MKKSILLSCLKLFFLTVLQCSFVMINAQTSSPMKVMTYNIWYDNPAMENNVWSKRSPIACEMLQKYEPDLIGMQEVLHHQLLDLQNCLPEYGYVGVGRNDGKEEGEYVPVFYKKDRYELLDHLYFWLSETPSIPGSKSWDACCTRMVTCVKLQDKESGTEFILCNTHFDQRSEEARNESARLLIDTLFNMYPDMPMILTGDFNFREGDIAYKILTEAGYRDAGKEVTSDAANPGFTFIGNDFNGEAGDIIDFIFTLNTVEVRKYKIIDFNKDGFYPSDHLPVLSEILIQ